MCTVVITLVCATTANAQSFPSDAAWTVVEQNGTPVGDIVGDGVGMGRELVGDASYPAFYVASDTDFLYFRIRLDTTPISGGVLRSYAWGVEFDTDANLAAYDYLIEVDGGTNLIELSRNSSSTTTGDPRDPAEVSLYTAPAVLGTNVRVSDALFPAPASNFGVTPDVYIDFAMPWSALLGAGLTRTQLVRHVAGVSNNSHSLTADVAGTAVLPGDGVLSLAASDPIPLGVGPGSSDGADYDVVERDQPPSVDTDAGVSGPAFHLEGGGCASSTPGLGALILVGAFLFARKRRRQLVVVLALVVPRAVHAQSSASFTLDRFRLATDRDGVLDAESAQIRRPLEIDLGLALGYAADELVVVDDRGRQVGSVVGRRVGANLVGSVGIVRGFQLGLELPFVLSQAGTAAMDVDLTNLASAAVGDLRLAPKVAIVDAAAAGVDVAFVPAVSLPTATADSLAGERGVAFLPELVVSRSVRALRCAADAGAFLRRTAVIRDMTVGNEVFARLGCGVLVDLAPRPVELDASLSFSTSLDDDSRASRGELLGGVSYAVTSQVALFAAGGFGIDHGFGAPEWRALAGSRLALEPAARARPLTAPAPAPDLQTEQAADHDQDGIADDVDACPIEPEDRNGHEDDDGCPEPAAPAAPAQER